MLGGCETMRQMDYLDRYLEPQAARDRRAGTLAGAPPPPLPPPVPSTRGGQPAQAPTPAPPAEVLPTEPTGALADAAPPPAAVWEEPPAAPAASPGAPPGASPGAPPVADTARATRSGPRQQPWMTRFWAQLTPAQRARVETRLRRRDGTSATQAPVVWDQMGLADRVSLAADEAPSLARSRETETGGP